MYKYYNIYSAILAYSVYINVCVLHVLSFKNGKQTHYVSNLKCPIKLNIENTTLTTWIGDKRHFLVHCATKESHIIKQLQL